MIQGGYETQISIFCRYETDVSCCFVNQLLEQTIRNQYDRLQVVERKLADAVLEMRCELAGYSATELAESAGVSKATASRLVRRLWFSGCQEMRQQCRMRPVSGSPLAALGGAHARKGALGRHLEHDVACLTRALEGISADLVRRAVEILAKASRIWVVGFRTSYTLALYACELLVQVKPDVRLLPVPGQTIAEELSALAENDAMLAPGFRRRPPWLAATLRTAAQAKAQIILVGDPTLGNSGTHADVTFRCLSRGSGVFDTFVAPISPLNYLASQVALALGEAAQQRLRRSEQLHDRFGDFSL
jgi:DNA-binding MurR/RpiR family transcriptional regulator